MRALIVLALAGSVVALAAHAATTPVPRPADQVPPATPPTAQAPRATAPTAQSPQATPPPIHVPQAQVVGQLPQDTALVGQPFEGTWTASGQRQMLPTEAGVSAVTIQLSGAVSIRVGTGLGRGFRGEVLGFDDGTGLAAGRAVWTDERGDRIFSVLQGDTLAAATRQMRAIITGGTGRYAGYGGEYEFTWRHLIAVDGVQVHGDAVNLRGHVRPGAGR